MVNVLTDFPEVTEMAAGSGSEVYQDVLFGRGLSSTGMVGIFKAGLNPSTGKGLLKQLQTVL